MPSEDLVQRALDALAGPREAFRAAVEAAVGEVGARIDAQRVHPEGKVERATHELGAFGAGRIDAGRFAAVFASGPTLSPGMIGRLEKAHERLRTIAERDEEQFVVRVPEGGDIRGGVARALAAIGGAFAAARDVEVARNGRSGSGGADEIAGGFAFRRWNRAERQIAPPLVVEVDGGDAQAIGLAEFLDGGQKIVLIFRGAAPAAPLARLATPGVFVLQTGNAADLAELVSVEGPAIAALVPEGCAEFVHRPGAPDGSKRLEIRHMPAEVPRSAVGSFSVLQQVEDLAYLRAVSAAAAAAAAVAERVGSAPVEAGMLAAPLNGAVRAQTGSMPAVTADGDSAAAAAGAVATPPPSASVSVPTGAGPGQPAPFLSVPTAAAAPPVAPADRLAAWLLRQADLNGTG